jgi:hypothetical protein
VRQKLIDPERGLGPTANPPDPPARWEPLRELPRRLTDRWGGWPSPRRNPLAAVEASAADNARSRHEQLLGEARVLPGSMALSRARREVSAAIGHAVPQLVGIGGATTLAQRVMPASAMQGIGQAMAHALLNTTTALTAEITRGMWNSVSLSARAAHEETYRRLQAATPLVEIDATYPKELQVHGAVKALDDAVNAEIAHPTPGRPDLWLEWRIRQRAVLTGLPTQAKRIGAVSHDASIEQGLRDMLGYYPPEKADELRRLVTRIRLNAMVDHPQRVQLYLHGPAGTGKTTFVQRMAQVLGLPLVCVKLPPKKLEELTGTPFNIASFRDKDAPDESFFGTLANALMKSDCTNAIVLIDEVTLTEHNLNFVKLLLNPDERKLRIGGHDAFIDWRRVTVILASNAPLANEALQSRCQQILFDQIHPDAKHRTAEGAMNEVMGYYEQRQATSTGRTQQLDLAQLRLACATALPLLVEIDNLHFAGSRLLVQVARDLVILLAEALARQPLRALSEAEVRHSIERTYSQATGATQRPTRRTAPGGVGADSSDEE